MTRFGEKINIGISTCLLGEKVRYDGSHRHDKYVTKTLGEYFDFVPFCPEVSAGLGTPRATIRLVTSENGPRVYQPKTETDVTDDIVKASASHMDRLKNAEIHGYILKSKSPSCGMERIKVYKESGAAHSRDGVGAFAKTLMEAYPNLPVEEEGRLSDPRIRENWVNRVFTYHDFKTALYPDPTFGKLVDFHSKNKYRLLSHCEKTYRELGQMVANHEHLAIEDILPTYEAKIMEAMKQHASVKKNMNVLLHMVGFFKKFISSEAKAHLLAVLDDYKNELVPVIVPITLINHYVKVHGVEYLANQSYLTPYPKELSLRNAM